MASNWYDLQNIFKMKNISYSKLCVCVIRYSDNFDFQKSWRDLGVICVKIK